VCVCVGGGEATRGGGGGVQQQLVLLVGYGGEDKVFQGPGSAGGRGGGGEGGWAQTRVCCRSRLPLPSAMHSGFFCGFPLFQDTHIPHSHAACPGHTVQVTFPMSHTHPC
jgi:hypothetical protein